MPMDASHRPMARISPADLHQQTDGERRICLVAKKVIVSVLDIADKFLGPMTLFAGLLRRAEIFYRSRDRFWIFFGSRRVHLVRTEELRADVPRCTFTDVTLRARHSSMRRMRVSHEFRFHYPVAGLTAELHRLRVMIALITANS